MTDALAVRKTTKAKKPSFIRQDTAKKKRLERKWRKPKGLQSKMRLHKAGRKRSPSPGWGSPASVRGFDRSGLKPVLVSCQVELDSLQKGEAAILSGTLGMKKKCEILSKAKEKNITVLNVRDIDAFLAEAKKKLEERKRSTKKKVLAPTKDEKKGKDDKKEGSGKKEEAPPSEKKDSGKTPTDETPQSDEEKKKREKEERDKVLTKKV